MSPLLVSLPDYYARGLLRLSRADFADKCDSGEIEELTPGRISVASLVRYCERRDPQLADQLAALGRALSSPAYLAGN